MFATNIIGPGGCSPAVVFYVLYLLIEQHHPYPRSQCSELMQHYLHYKQAHSLVWGPEPHGMSGVDPSRVSAVAGSPLPSPPLPAGCICRLSSPVNQDLCVHKARISTLLLASLKFGHSFSWEEQGKEWPHFTHIQVSRSPLVSWSLHSDLCFNLIGRSSQQLWRRLQQMDTQHMLRCVEAGTGQVLSKYIAVREQDRGNFKLLLYKKLLEHIFSLFLALRFPVQ